MNHLTCAIPFKNAWYRNMTFNYHINAKIVKAKYVTEQ